MVCLLYFEIPNRGEGGDKFVYFLTASCSIGEIMRSKWGAIWERSITFDVREELIVLFNLNHNLLLL